MVNEVPASLPPDHAKPRTLRRNPAPPRPFVLQAQAGAAQDRPCRGTKHVQGKGEKDDPGRVQARVRGICSRRGRHPARDVAGIRVEAGRGWQYGKHGV